MASENGTFSYQPTISGTYTWSFRMKNSGTVAQPASVYYLDNLVASYPIPYTSIDCDKGQNASYRFGFNGKENDTKTLTQDYGFRIYNPGLGRFLSVDPFTKNYPELTSYQFASNSSIQGIDLDGGELLPISSAMYQLKYLENLPLLGGAQSTDVYNAEIVNHNLPANYDHSQLSSIYEIGVNGVESKRLNIDIVNGFKMANGEPLCGTNFVSVSNNSSTQSMDDAAPEPQEIKVSTKYKPTKNPNYHRPVGLTIKSVDAKPNMYGSILGLMALTTQGMEIYSTIMGEIAKIQETLDKMRNIEKNQRNLFYKATIIVNRYCAKYNITDKKFKADLVNYDLDGTNKGNSLEQQKVKTIGDKILNSNGIPIRK